MSFLRRFTKRPPPPAKEPDDEAPKDDAPRKSRFTLFGGKKKDDAAPPKKRKSWFGGGKKDKEEIPEEPEDAPAVALAVDVPSERPNALHVALHRCRNLPVMDVNLLSKNSSDPFVVLECCGAKEKSTTKKRCLDPYYGERFALPLDGGDESVKCTVFDEDVVSSHDFMGVADIACAPLADRRPTKRWYKLLGKKGDASKDLGEIQLTLHWVHDPSRLLELPLCEPGDAKNELVVALRRARHLRALDRNLLTENSSDPFAILRCDGEEAKSKVVYNTCDIQRRATGVFFRVKKRNPTPSRLVGATPSGTRSSRCASTTARRPSASSSGTRTCCRRTCSASRTRSPRSERTARRRGAASRDDVRESLTEMAHRHRG